MSTTPPAPGGGAQSESAAGTTQGPTKPYLSGKSAPLTWNCLGRNTRFGAWSPPKPSMSTSPRPRSSTSLACSANNSASTGSSRSTSTDPLAACASFIENAGPEAMLTQLCAIGLPQCLARMRAVSEAARSCTNRSGTSSANRRSATSSGARPSRTKLVAVCTIASWSPASDSPVCHGKVDS